MKQYLADTALLPGGWHEDVRITVSDDGRIVSVEPGATGYREDVRLGQKVLVPAMCNLHSHAFQRALSGRTESSAEAHDTFWTWRHTMYRLVGALSPEHIEAVSALAYCEMLEHGFGAVAEFHYLHHAPGGKSYADIGETSARVAAAASEAGIGITLLPVLYMSPDDTPLEPEQQRFACAPDIYVRLLDSAKTSTAKVGPDAQTGSAAHSVRAVSVEALQELTRHATDAPFHMHAAEQLREVSEFQARTGARPVEWLLHECDVDPRWCLVHCTHMNQVETMELARRGAVAGVCPVTEANLGDGIFEGTAWIDAGGRIGIGTDSNVSIGLSDELRLLEYGQRLRDRARLRLRPSGPSVGPGLLNASLAGGAQALGRESGALEAGSWADMIAIDAAHVGLAGLEGDQILDGWIFGTGDDIITDVWSAGRHVVREGRHIRRDAIEKAYRSAIDSLRDVL